MIGSQTSFNQYTGNNTTPTYDFNFQVDVATDLAVYETVNGVTNQLVLNTDYTLLFNFDQSTGGSITLTAGNLAMGNLLLLIREPALTQEEALAEQTDFTPADYETALDKLEEQIQWLQVQLNQCLKFPIWEQQLTTLLGDAAARAGMTISFDNNGNAILVTGGGGETVTIPSVANQAALAGLPKQLGFAFTQDAGQMWYFNVTTQQWQGLT